MLIIGHSEIIYEPFYFINSADDIDVTPSNSTVVFEYSKDKLELCRYCQKNSVSFALICDEVKDVLLASANGASYIVCDKKNIQKAQKYADSYMFDAKVLLYTSDENDIIWCADHEIDGIVFEDGISYEVVG